MRAFFARLTENTASPVLAQTPPALPSDAAFPLSRNRSLAGIRTAALLVALLALAASANAQTVISAGTGRSQYTAGTTVTTALALSTGADTVKTALAVESPAWLTTVKPAYDNNLKATADVDRTGDPVFNAFKTAYGSATFITDYFYKVVVSSWEGWDG